MIIDKKKNIALTGSAAAAKALGQIEPEVMPVYPITPQTPIIETYAQMVSEGEVITEMIEVESEHSAMSACVGASAAGARAITASSSQGLLLMSEILPIAAGLRLPILMVVSSRAISAPINIHGDHQDVMALRDLGWIQIFCENVQEVYDTTILAMRLAEMVRLPVMVIMDGFTTSHCVENLEIIDDRLVSDFVGKCIPKKHLLDFADPKSFGPVALPNSYFEFKRSQLEAVSSVMSTFNFVAGEFKKISQRNYEPIETYQIDDAEKILVIAGSNSGTAKVAVDELRNEGLKAGVVKIRMFRPFPYLLLKQVLNNIENIAVMDRSLSFGSNPPLYSEVLNALFFADKQVKIIQSYVYGLGGREIFKEEIKSIFKKEWENSRVRFVGLK